MSSKKPTTAEEHSDSSADEQSESEEIVDKMNTEGSDSDEDKEEQSGDDEGGDEKTIAQTQAKLQTKAKKPQPSSETEDSGSDSDSDEDSQERTPSPAASGLAVKPISSKPMDKPKKPAPKPSAADPKSGTKRPAKDQNGKDGSIQNKKTKVDEEKKSNPHRLWSEDDEVAILKGVLDFKTKRGLDAFTEMGSFHEFVKKDLSVDVTKNQLWDKARRLKKKYQTLLEKRVNGEDPVFAKPVEYKCYHIAKKIWDIDNANTLEGSSKTATKKRTTKPAKFENSLTSPKRESKALSLPGNSIPEKKSNGVVEDVKMDEEDFYSSYPELEGSLEAENMNLSVPEAVVNVVKETMPLIGSAKAKELDEKWKNLRAEQIRLFLKQLDLVQEQTKMALDAMEASKS